jgi:hypothetical protein
MIFNFNDDDDDDNYDDNYDHYDDHYSYYYYYFHFWKGNFQVLNYPSHRGDKLTSPLLLSSSSSLVS